MRWLVRRAAISVIAGFLASGFALGALIHTERPDEMRRLPDDLSGDLVLAVLSALRGAGIPAALAVLLCVLVYDAVRWLVGQISARRDLFMPRLRLAATAMRHWWWWSAMPRIRRTVVAVALIVGSIFAGGLAVVIYAVVVSASFEAVRASTRFVGALLDDPPALPMLALGLSGAFGLMYFAVGLSFACLWVPYRLARALAKGSDVALYRQWT